MRTRTDIPNGFTLIEVLVALAIMIVLAATITPNIMGALDAARIRRTVSSLQAIEDALAQIEADTNHSAKFLDQLAEDVVAGDPDVCDKNFGGQANSWNGPYLSRLVPGTGLPIGVGIVQNLIEFTNQTGKQDLATLRIPDVTIEDAQALDTEIDGVEDGTLGSVRYGAPVNGFVEITYRIPIPNC